jgi:hypothetical protein
VQLVLLVRAQHWKFGLFWARKLILNSNAFLLNRLIERGGKASAFCVSHGVGMIQRGLNLLSCMRIAKPNDAQFWHPLF